jgi:Tfp pilus assembly protein PilW
MDFMTTITRSLTPRPLRRLEGRAAFTLVEVLIAATLSSAVLAGILSTFLFMGRAGANLQNYSDMESQARRSLEVFAQDVRQASAISWNSSTSVTLTVNSVAVLYRYDSTTAVFSRTVASATQALVTGIAPGTFALKGFNLSGVEMPLATAANLTAASTSTKQLQISLEASRNTRTVTVATNLVLSARYILRNKIVTA